MPERFVTRGFVGRREPAGTKANRIPPGQHLVKDFPVLSAGPTPRTDLAKWTFRIEGLVKEPAQWTWSEFQDLPAQEFVSDISCVTKWTKLDTHWRGVSVDVPLEHVELDRRAPLPTPLSAGGYHTNPSPTETLPGQAYSGGALKGKTPPAPASG